MKSQFKILILVFIVVLIGGVLMLKLIVDQKPVPLSGVMIVNSKNTITENVTIYYKKNASYSTLPIVELFKSLGADFKWIDYNSAYMTFKEKNYILNLADTSLIEVGDKINLFDCVDGGQREYTILERELILDDVTIRCATMIMGEKIDCRYDHEKLIVYITKRNK